MLNILNEYRDDVIDNMPVLTPILELDSPPSEEELSQALSSFKKRKAEGKSGILPELILCGGPELWSRTLKVIQQVWREGRVMRDWQEAVVVPVPKYHAIIGGLGTVTHHLVEDSGRFPTMGKTVSPITGMQRSVLCSAARILRSHL